MMSCTLYLMNFLANELHTLHDITGKECMQQFNTTKWALHNIQSEPLARGPILSAIKPLFML
jgi:hypothetical protein